jgi:hypothetical protein
MDSFGNQGNLGVGVRHGESCSSPNVSQTTTERNERNREEEASL